MELKDAIKNRRSIRKYKQEFEIKYEDIIELLSIAQNSPSANNIRDFYFIIVKEKNNIENLAKIANQDFIRDSKAIVIFCYDSSKFKSLYGEKGEKFAIESLSALIENFLLLLQEKNLGGCWIGEFDENKLKTTFGIPQNIEVVAFVTIGVPNENPSESKKRSLDELIFFETWGSKGKKYKPDYYPLSENISKIIEFIKK